MVKGLRFMVLLTLVGLLCWADTERKDQTNNLHAGMQLVLPLLTSPPIVDGKITEPIWRSAITFTLCDKLALSVRCGFDKNGLWFALESKNVPQNARAVLTFRVTERRSYFPSH